MIKYCIKCVLPATKPYIKFNKLGICSACDFHEKKIKIIKVKLIGLKGERI